MQAQERTIRLASASFLSSYLARFTPLPATAVTATLRQLAAFARRYSAAHAPMRRSLSRPLRSWGPGNAAAPSFAGALRAPAADGPTHEVYYAACQAILYTLCYHLQPHAPGGAAAPPALAEFVRAEVAPLLAGALQPLPTCLPSVAHEFVKQAAELGLGDLSGLLAPEGTPTKRPFDMFFPFDPYLLPLSLPLLRLDSCYRRWRHGHVVPDAACVTRGADDEDVDDAVASSTSESSDSEDSDVGNSDDLDAASPASHMRSGSDVHAAGRLAAPEHNPFAAARALQPASSPQPCAAAAAAVGGLGVSSPSENGFLNGASYASSPGAPRLGSDAAGGVAMSLSDPIDCMVNARIQRRRHGWVGAASSPGGNALMACTPEVVPQQWSRP